MKRLLLWSNLISRTFNLALSWPLSLSLSGVFNNDELSVISLSVCLTDGVTQTTDTVTTTTALYCFLDTQQNAPRKSITSAARYDDDDDDVCYVKRNQPTLLFGRRRFASREREGGKSELTHSVKRVRAS